MNKLDLEIELDYLKDDLEEVENRVARLSSAKHFQVGQFQEQLKERLNFYNNKYRVNLINENQLQDFLNKKIEELEIKLQGK